MAAPPSNAPDTKPHHLAAPPPPVYAFAPPPPPPPPPQWPLLPPAPVQFAPPQFVPAFHPPPPMPPSPAPHVRQYPPPSPAPVGGEDNRTIWVGDLHYWMDENYLHSCFAFAGEVAAIKVIRNKHTGQSEGYGFVEFYSRAAAEKILQSFPGHVMPNTDQLFRLNWASFSMGDRRTDAASDHSIFVGDLATDVTDATLLETFSSRYASVKGAKVVIDATTGRSKGYGFVRFGDDSEKNRAMSEMNGVYCSSRPMRIGPATPRKSSGNGVPMHSDGDFTNTTVFVGGLDASVSEDDLKQKFSQYGDLAAVKIPLGKQCGFVQFVHRKNAEEAMQGLNGTTFGKQTVRLSWGRNPAYKQPRGDVGKQWGGMYYGPQFYNGYGYPASPFPDPSVYGAATYAGGYPFYGNQQQVS